MFTAAWVNTAKHTKNTETKEGTGALWYTQI